MDPTRTALVTGASSGIGLETARELARAGHRVLLVGRDGSRLRAAVESIRESTGAPSVEALRADFSSLDEVRALARDVRERCDALHVLVNNAGVWHPKRTLSKDGYEDTWAVNHLAPFLLTNLLLDRLGGGGSAPARVVTVSSRLHSSVKGIDWDDLRAERRYSGLRAYGQSKLANVLFSNELARRLGASRVTSNAVHPGDVATNVIRDHGLLSLAQRLVGRHFLLTPAEGARTTVHVATAPELETVTGEYFARCRPSPTSAAARDGAAAARLWDVSWEMVGGCGRGEV